MALHLQNLYGSLLRLKLFIDDASRLNQDRQTMEEIRKILLDEKEKIGLEIKSRQINQFNTERDVGDEVDNSVVEQERELNLLLQDREKQHLEAIDEAIEIGVGADVPLEIYHLKAGGRRNWHKASQAITKIDEARADGIDVQANMYPYTAGGTGLTACFPPWASADGKLFDNLADEVMRDRIRSEVTNQTEEWENMCMLATPEGVLLLGLEKPENQKYAGRYLDDVANEYGKHWIETAMDLVLSEEQRVGTIYFMMDENNVRLQLQQPWMKFGTDAGGVNPAVVENLVHPRAYGTYPRILGRYVRDEGVLSLEEAVRKLSLIHI